MKFLIIDEGGLMTRVLVEHLVGDGHECTRLTETTEALREIEVGSPDAIILDVNDKDSNEVRRLIESIIRLCKKPIILYTVLGPDRKQVKVAMRTGAVGRVSKKMSMPDKIIKAIMKIIINHEKSESN